MSEVYDLLKKVLRSDSDVVSAISKVSRFISKTDNTSKYLPILRTLECLRDNKLEDFCANLRQSLCYFPGNVEISHETMQIVKSRAIRYGFNILDDGITYQLNIKPYMFADNPDLCSRYDFEFRKTSKYSIGDGMLYGTLGYKTYLTFTQKYLMYLISIMNRNETVLACLPTGGGKSLSWELPSVSGCMCGTVIVVVPTIALACDHEISSKKAFENTFDVSGKVKAYHGNLPSEQKNEILSQIESGEISILYISPEALIRQEFKRAVFRAAKNNIIGMLVVDEAHLIAQWGIRFRPEFQLLAAFRNRLQELSANGIKTLLLSATLNDEDTEIIKRVFNSEIFTEYRADELRPEPSYYLHMCRNKTERYGLIREICGQAPRPIIVYAAIPEMAESYYYELRRDGFKNIGLFTGQTHSNKRDELINLWRNNKIDIMVATSAFGMGVDKADVRTIVTGYIPENISRFYQEVGRAGRDGYASLSYWLPLEEDWDIVDSLTKNAIMTTELIVDRWDALIKHCSHVDASSMWLDINTARDELKHTITGENNRGWNKDVILFLVRIGLIEVLDIDYQSKEAYRILIRLNNIPVLENKDKLLNFISAYRSIERQRINDSKANVKNLIENKTWCFADSFVGEFPYSTLQCSGCPVCRASNNEAYRNSAHIRINTNKEHIRSCPFDSSDDILAIYLSSRKNIMISYDKIFKDKELNDCIAKLVRRGVNIVVLPAEMNEESLLERLQSVRRNDYLLINYEELEAMELSWITGICALIYTEDANYNNKLFKFSEKFLKDCPNNKVLHIAYENTIIREKRKPLFEICDCSVLQSQMG